MASVTIQHGAKRLRIDVPEVTAAALRRVLLTERETKPERSWRRLVLACSECRRPCIAGVECPCCTGGPALHAHPVLMTVDDFLARAERLLTA